MAREPEGKLDQSPDELKEFLEGVRDGAELGAAVIGGAAAFLLMFL